ncbi:MAG TPA: PadR family transcriptional regulator [Candidatus Saccharimonadales bacterium]|nr:PadR family transcriptional regulator [Candidatus Saccharimonadales bacterium]
MTKTHNQLPQVAFSILLALSLRERHGYEIIKQVAEDSNGKIHLGPGPLYTSIKQLLEQKLVEEVEKTEDSRRRYYRLSKKGRTALVAELDYYRNTITLAQERQVLEILYGISY